MLLQKVFHPISRHKAKKEMSSVVFICLQEGITSKVFLSQYRSSVRTVHLIFVRFSLVALLTLFPNFFFFLLLCILYHWNFFPSVLASFSFICYLRQNFGKTPFKTWKLVLQVWILLTEGERRPTFERKNFTVWYRAVVIFANYRQTYNPLSKPWYF